MRLDGVLLLAAALLSHEATAAAPPWNVRRKHDLTRALPLVNTTTSSLTPSTKLPTTIKTTTTTSHPEPVASAPQISVPSYSEAVPPIAISVTLGGNGDASQKPPAATTTAPLWNSTSHTLITGNSSTLLTTTSSKGPAFNSTALSSVLSALSSSLPSWNTTQPSNSTAGSNSSATSNISASVAPAILPPTGLPPPPAYPPGQPKNQTGAATPPAIKTSKHKSKEPMAHTTKKCTSLPASKAVTEFVVMYTSTITFYGNSSAYTPPYERLTLPEYCSSSTVEPPRLPEPSSASSSNSEWEIFTMLLPTGHLTKTASSVFFTGSSGNTFVRASGITGAVPRVTSTLQTTDKNPSVIYKPGPTPDYSPTSQFHGGPGQGNHNSAVGNQPNPIHSALPQPPSFTVTAGNGQVIINSRTITGLGPGVSTVVTVGGGKFTIDPSRIVGEGATITRPPPEVQGTALPPPITTAVGGVSVAISGSQAVIDGHTITIPHDGTSTVIDGKTILLGPGTVIVDGQALTFPSAPPPRTDVVVAGGQLLTLEGQSIVVVHSTTFTYGPNIAATTEVINDDTITLGPSGVVIHGTMLGGLNASVTGTEYEIVGGATITKIAPSVVIINGATFAVGPNAKLRTTVVGDQTITIGPDGVTIATMTMNYPFGSSIVTTISPTGTWLNDFPTETAGASVEEDGGVSVRPNTRVGALGLCIAIGVWVLV